jgi:phospholipid/cholesterol/gamma-HCH transport system permease protein
MTVEQTAQLVIETQPASQPPTVALRCAGDWTVRGIAALEPRLAALSGPAGGVLTIDASAIAQLDTAGAWLLQRTLAAQQASGADVRVTGLRPEFDTLLKLVADHAAALRPAAPAATGLLTDVGRRTWTSVQGLLGMLAFVGEAAVLVLRSLLQPRRIRWRPVLHNLQLAGFEALPIVGLLSFLMGVVIAYQGADQLQRFGANIFIVDLVGLAMLRELSPLLTAIIVAGRSGSAFTAQIGTMKISEEIDALRTIGVAPQELLVLPKMLALLIALPLLTVYADAAGVLGGMIMARTQLDVGFSLFIDRLGEAIDLSTLLTGVGKAPVFAVIIALVGCYQGFQASGSADSVGRQTTISVVQAIFLVIVADALFSVAFNWFDI